jgi:hypothetical protein
MFVKLDRPVAQAGSVLKGKVCLKMGNSDQKMLEQFTAGAMVELAFRGDERVFWAQGYSHNPENRTAKLLTNGQKRREAMRNLVMMQQQLRQVNPMELRTPNALIEMPFQFILNEALPSSFLYAGENMCMFQVEYWLDVKIFGLTAT